MHIAPIQNPPRNMIPRSFVGPGAVPVAEGGPFKVYRHQGLWESTPLGQVPGELPDVGDTTREEDYSEQES